jgi:uncharacterized protein YbcC (UPF0753/DUF2309 family)
LDTDVDAVDIYPDRINCWHRALTCGKVFGGGGPAFPKLAAQECGSSRAREALKARTGVRLSSDARLAASLPDLPASVGCFLEGTWR